MSAALTSCLAAWDMLGEREIERETFPVSIKMQHGENDMLGHDVLARVKVLHNSYLL